MDVSMNDDLTQGLDTALAAFFEPSNNSARNSSQPLQYADADIQKVSAILRHIKLSWSRVPRTYIVLRTIGQLPFIDDFIDLGFTDHWFPVAPQSLPGFLSPTARTSFVQAQKIILTKSIDLEKGENGQHRNFGRDEPIPFKTIAVLGNGGYGKVDKVLSTISFKEYARKSIRRKVFFGDALGGMHAFLAELSVWKRLKHRHTVELVGSYTSPGHFGLIMSPVADSNLTEFLGGVRTSDEQRSLMRGFFGCLVTALEYLHSSEVRHKDIKPENILVQGENVLLADFGLARDCQDGSGSTTEGLTALSPRYCAPEVFAYERRNSSADIWSLGCVFLEMLTVLKGETIDTMRQYFEVHGSQGQFVRTNPDATNEWVEVLRKAGSLHDNRPLNWIRSMLNRDRYSRPTAMQLVQTITSTSFSIVNVPFCGLCCLDNDENNDSDCSLEAVIEKDDGSERFRRTQEAPFDPQRGRMQSPTRTFEGSPPPRASSNGQDNIHVESSATPEVIFTDMPKYHFATEEPADPESKRTWWLFHGAEVGEASLIVRAVNSGVDVNSRGYMQETALHWAAKSNEEGVVRLLVDRGADVTAVSSRKESALHWAAGSPGTNAQTIRTLCQLGARLEATNDVGKTPLFNAVSAERVDFVRSFLEMGASITPLATIPSPAWTLLHEAAWYGHAEILAMLLSHGARVEAADQYGTTPLHVAALRGHLGAIKYLLGQGASLAAKAFGGSTPLHTAAFYGEMDAVEILLQNGAVTNLTDDKGQTALEVARADGNEDLIRLFLAVEQ